MTVVSTRKFHPFKAYVPSLDMPEKCQLLQKLRLLNRRWSICCSTR